MEAVRPKGTLFLCCGWKVVEEVKWGPGPELSTCGLYFLCTSMEAALVNVPGQQDPRYEMSPSPSATYLALPTLGVIV